MCIVKHLFVERSGIFLISAEDMGESVMGEILQLRFGDLPVRIKVGSVGHSQELSDGIERCDAFCRFLEESVRVVHKDTVIALLECREFRIGKLAVGVIDKKPCIALESFRKLGCFRPEIRSHTVSYQLDARVADCICDRFAYEPREIKPAASDLGQEPCDRASSQIQF